jgi:POT family proton-dependent oligopeptide transporter
VIFDAIKALVFSIGINTGSLLATMVICCCCKWDAGFGLAGIAMLLGLVVYIWDKNI